MKTRLFCACAALALTACSPAAKPQAKPAEPVAAAPAPPAAAPGAPPDLVIYPPFTPAKPHGPAEPKTFDARGAKLLLPLGDASFADEVVAFRSGEPAATILKSRDAGIALGVPDYISDADDESTFPKDLTLGCGGVVTLKFTDNALIDVPGPDLYVFEVGPAVEATNLEISPDGVAWTAVGQISGGTAEVDISGKAQPDARYHYVRLTDQKTSCGGAYSGADIDAVAAIGAALSISLDSAVLFDVDKAVLKPAALTELDRAAAQLKSVAGKSIAIEGHTDSTGDATHNQTLSQARAQAVRDYLAKRPELAGKTLTAKGFAATRPVASNGDDAGRAKNRRVEVILAPDKK